MAFLCENDSYLQYLDAKKLQDIDKIDLSTFKLIFLKNIFNNIRGRNNLNKIT